MVEFDGSGGTAEQGMGGTGGEACFDEVRVGPGDASGFKNGL